MSDIGHKHHAEHSGHDMQGEHDMLRVPGAAEVYRDTGMMVFAEMMGNVGHYAWRDPQTFDRILGVAFGAQSLISIPRLPRTGDAPSVAN